MHHLKPLAIVVLYTLAAPPLGFGVVPPFTLKKKRHRNLQAPWKICSVLSWIASQHLTPTFAAKFAPSQACRGSIPAALGAPPPVSVSSASTPPPPVWKSWGSGAGSVSPSSCLPRSGFAGSAGCSVAFRFRPHPFTVSAFYAPSGLFPVRVSITFRFGNWGAG